MLNNLSRYPAVFIGGFFAAGILLQSQLAVSALLLTALLLLLFVPALIYRGKQTGLFCLAGLFLIAGMLHLSGWWQRTDVKNIASLLPIKGIYARLVVDDPQPHNPGQVTGRLLELDSGTGKIMPHRRALLRCRRGKLDRRLMPGDTLLMQNAVLRSIPLPRNPGQFNYRRYLKWQGIYLLAEVDSIRQIRSTYYRGAFSFHRFFYRLRRRLSLRIQRFVPGTGAAFLRAILLGEKQALPAGVKSDFQNTGVAHVLAISGLHVGFVVIVIYLLISFLPLHFKLRYALTIFFLVAYMFLTGANPPVVRATLMVSLYLAGKLLERKANIYNTLFLAGFFILLVQPQQLFWVGFQFSFVAVFTIVFFYQRLTPLKDRLFARLSHWPAGQQLDRFLIVPFFVSLAAQLGTLPLTAVYFYNLPLASFVLNLLVIPLTGLIVGLGILVLGVSFIFTELALFTGELASWVIQVQISAVHFAALLPFAFLKIPRFPMAVFAAYALLLLLAFYGRHPVVEPVRKQLAAAVLVLILYLFAPANSPAQLLMLDVGQGESLLFKTAAGQMLLFDAGPASRFRDSGKDVIVPALRDLGYRHLHKVFISHPHWDHAAGFFSLQKEVAIDSVYLPDIKIAYFWQDSLVRLLKKRKIGYRFLKAGDMVTVDRQTRIYLLAPFNQDLSPPSRSGHDINNLSLVALIRSGNRTILFPGDAEKNVENRVLQWNGLLRSDVLVVGHHGSITSSSTGFIRAVSPAIALVSVGKYNKYGHPSPLIINRLRRRGIAVYRTDQTGAVWLRQDEKGWRQVNWRRLD